MVSCSGGALTADVKGGSRGPEVHCRDQDSTRPSKGSGGAEGSEGVKGYGGSGGVRGVEGFNTGGRDRGPAPGPQAYVGG